MTWQKRALAYIDLIPELAYASRFYSRMLQPLRLFPAVSLPDGTYEPITEGLPVEALSRLRGKDGTPRLIQGNYGRLMFATGEGTLLGIKLESDEESWSFVWNEEVEVNYAKEGQVKEIIHFPYGKGKKSTTYGPLEARAYRLWTPHPRLSGEADSPMRSVLEIAEELIILTAAVRATATSRIVNGIMVLPSEMAPTPPEPTGDEDGEQDTFMEEFLTHVEAQIENAGSASAASPWFLWAGYEFIDRARMIWTHDTQNDYMEQNLRKEAVERMARGMDFPAEYLMGLANANHWAAKQILDDMWRTHGSIVAGQYVGDLTDAYLRPILDDADYPDYRSVVVRYDESAVVVPPDQSADADSARDRGDIGGRGYRLMKNIPEDYKPTKEEHDEWLAIKMRDPALLGVNAPVVAPPDPRDGPPEPGPEGDSGRKTRVVNASIEMGAAISALARCREIAGVRLRKKERLCPDCFQHLNGAPDENVAAALGPEVIEKLAANPATLVLGGADTFRKVLSSLGYSSTQSADIAETLESYAARTLFKTNHLSLPGGFGAHFERAKEAADVGN